MSVMRFLQNISCLLFVPSSVGATESEWVLLPRARDALLGETFRGNRQSRGPPSGRAQGLTPEAEPNRSWQKRWTRKLREHIPNQTSKTETIDKHQHPSALSISCCCLGKA